MSYLYLLVFAALVGCVTRPGCHVIVGPQAWCEQPAGILQDIKPTELPDAKQK
jgi:hypothetical protein